MLPSGLIFVLGACVFTSSLSTLSLTRELHPVGRALLFPDCDSLPNRNKPKRGVRYTVYCSVLKALSGRLLSCDGMCYTHGLRAIASTTCKKGPRKFMTSKEENKNKKGVQKWSPQFTIRQVDLYVIKEFRVSVDAQLLIFFIKSLPRTLPCTNNTEY